MTDSIVANRDEQVASVLAKLKELGLEDPNTGEMPVTGQFKASIPTPFRHAESDDPEEVRRQRCWDLGLENQRHYLTQAAKSGKPWHSHTKTDDQYSEWIVQTPEMMQLLLDEFNVHKEWGENRRQKKKAIQNYANDILNDVWFPTPEAIAFDSDNCIADGQNRLCGGLAAHAKLQEQGKELEGVLFWHTFNCLPRARLFLDQGVRRTAMDRINFTMKNNIGSALPAIARSMMKGMAVGATFSDTEVIEFCNQYGPMIEWAYHRLKPARADMRAAVAKAALWYGPDAVDDFCDRFSKLAFLTDQPGDPARRLYCWYNSNKTSRNSGALSSYSKTVSALKAHVEGRQISMLRAVQADIFEFERHGNQWIVPSH